MQGNRTESLWFVKTVAVQMKRPNHAIERTADPRHVSCVRTCRASGRGPLIANVRRD
jgi:hypothetical protein